MVDAGYARATDNCGLTLGASASTDVGIYETVNTARGVAPFVTCIFEHSYVPSQHRICLQACLRFLLRPPTRLSCWSAIHVPYQCPGLLNSRWDRVVAAVVIGQFSRASELQLALATDLLPPHYTQRRLDTTAFVL